MFDGTLLTAGVSALLLGAALLRALRVERRRASIESRLKAIASAPVGTEGLVAALRRPHPQRRALPKALSMTVELALAATGNRVGVLHLAAAGALAGAVLGLAATVAELPSALAIVLGVAATAGTPVLLIRGLQSRYQRQFLDAFPDSLDLIVRAVRTGIPAPEAMEIVTREIRPPVGTEFRQLLDELRIGTEMEDALQHAADRIRGPDFHFFVVSLLLQRQTGGGIAETLANLSHIIRQRKALRLKARALTSEAQASAAIVAATPFVAGVGLFLINRQLVSVLFFDARGRFMLGLAVAGLLMGVATMRALIKRSLR